MENTNPLAQYCKNDKERKLVENYIKNSENSKSIFYIFTVFAIILAIGVLVIAFTNGFRDDAVTTVIWAPIACAIFAAQSRNESILGTIFKRISESQNTTNPSS